MMSLHRHSSMYVDQVKIKINRKVGMINYDFQPGALRFYDQKQLDPSQLHMRKMAEWQRAEAKLFT